MQVQEAQRVPNRTELKDIQSFPGQKMLNFITTKPVLPEMLKGVFEEGGGEKEEEREKEKEEEEKEKRRTRRKIKNMNNKMAISRTETRIDRDTENILMVARWEAG